MKLLFCSDNSHMMPW